ncbi:MAG: protein kinase [Lachnospiraceae bacterium]|nr:protein kinase [Lachnospiraceae bacterium]
MSEIVAGLYEKTEEIGAGGGGIVYLGRHLRLDKPVVLKYDKRTLRADTKVLRREVDLLKGLTHTYIPQVYDFVQENDAVYTVMDYIEGESLDKLIKRGEIPDQKKVIRWACQLLEALAYLHSRPPHGILHGDIKPANIMLRPNGDVCLIDYNIALALGEDGAVRVGYSRGYASPEHYGYTYASEKSSGRVFLDVRSDIYSLGATLYHLISGHKPAENAEEVTALSKDVCSPAVAAIILKAMKPNPDDRYQTADEMLQAFRGLYKNDIRVLRRKRRIVITSVALGLVFLAGCGLTFIGLKQMEQQKKALALAEYSTNALQEGDVTGAVEQALEALPGTSIFDGPVTAPAQKALTAALGVYELSDKYMPLGTVPLPAEPFHAGLSPDGRYLAAIYAYELGIYDVAGMEKIASLEAQESALSDFVFTDDGKIIYAGSDGITAYDIEGGSTVWTKGAATTLALSGDGKRVAAVNRSDSDFFVYDTATGEEIYSGSFGEHHLPVPVNDLFADPDKAVFELNEKGNFLAASLDNGALVLCDIEKADNDILIMEGSDVDSFNGGFIGGYFAYVANKTGDSEFGITDIEKQEQIAGHYSDNELILKTDDDELYLADGGVLVSMGLPDFDQREMAYVPDGSITGFACRGDNTIVAVDDKSYIIFDKGGNRIQGSTVTENLDFLDVAGKYIMTASRNGPDIAVLSTEDHTDAIRFKYDPGCAHDEARISGDGKTAVLFDINGFAVFDAGGKELANISLPDPESIYDQQFVRGEGNGSCLEVTWYDGTVRDYSALDGSLIKEEKISPPEKNLYEEFLADRYRIASSLHEAPVVFDRETGRQLAVLKEEANLTYVTETGYGLMTEYISTDGERYGLLLNDVFEPIAVLPGLCDVYEDKVLFDYGSGDLRQCRLYSLDELKALGEERLNGKERD